jgi:hypothetical protein
MRSAVPGIVEPGAQHERRETNRTFLQEKAVQATKQKEKREKPTSPRKTNTNT